MKIDPTFELILTAKSWPLAIPLIDPSGTAYYECYLEDQLTKQRTIYYRFNGKRFKLVTKSTK